VCHWNIACGLVLGDEDVGATLALEIGGRGAGLGCLEPHHYQQASAAGRANTALVLGISAGHPIMNTAEGITLRSGWQACRRRMASGVRSFFGRERWRALRDSNPC